MTAYGTADPSRLLNDRPNNKVASVKHTARGSTHVARQRARAIAPKPLHARGTDTLPGTAQKAINQEKTAR